MSQATPSQRRSGGSPTSKVKSTRSRSPAPNAAPIPAFCVNWRGYDLFDVKQHVFGHVGPANVPSEFCLQHIPVSPATHPALFASDFVISRLAGTHSLDPKWRTIPKLYSGHDISGHMFLLTMSVFFLAEQISLSLPLLYPSLEPVPGTVRYRASFLHEVVVKASMALLGVWFMMSWTTSVYFHTPFEKVTGFLAGLVAAYLIKLPIPILSRAPPPAPHVVPLDKPEI
ncbi:hypothetical protein RSAG8_05048, partial [Rhizoctonia solani AG-8 WAC10335]